MAEKGILFNGEMVRAILAGRKTQTRRPNTGVDRQDLFERFVDGRAIFRDTVLDGLFEDGPRYTTHKPPYQPGDLLYIRETWQVYRIVWESITGNKELGDPLLFIPKEKPDNAAILHLADHNQDLGPWRPSIHMPKWAARPARLLVTGVRTQRVQDISNEDICLELGIPVEWPGPGPEPYKRDLETCFAYAWDAIYAKRGLSWDTNPWVWAYTFEVQEAT